MPATRTLVLSLLLIALGGTAKVGNAEADRARAKICGSSDGHTVIARDAEAEVYRLREHTLAAAKDEYRGCVYGSKRSFRLGRELLLCDPSGCFMVDHVVLAGTTVAYEMFLTSSFSLVESEWRVAVVDLRSGRVLHKVPTGVTSPPNKEFVGDGQVTAIVVKPDGAVAWILNTAQSENRYQVHALDLTGERMLAVGSNIAPASLALVGSTLYWTQGGKPFSAALD